MGSTNSKSERRIIRWLLPLAAVVWFCIAFWAINWVGESKFKDFDPELRLSSEMMSLSMEAELLSLLPAPEFAFKAVDIFGALNVLDPVIVLVCEFFLKF